MFSTLEIIKDLAKKRGISLAKLEQTLGYSANYFYTLKTKAPNSDRLKEIADYFNVSTDYLLGRTITPHVISDEANGQDTELSRKARAVARKYDAMSKSNRQKFEELLKIMQIDDEDDD